MRYCFGFHYNIDDFTFIENPSYTPTGTSSPKEYCSVTYFSNLYTVTVSFAGSTIQYSLTSAEAKRYNIRGKQYLAASVMDENTLKRELDPLQKIPDNYPKLILHLPGNPRRRLNCYTQFLPESGQTCNAKSYMVE